MNFREYLTSYEFEDETFWFMDIETFKYNLREVKQTGKQTNAKSREWIVQLAYFTDGEFPEYVEFISFEEFLNTVAMFANERLKDSKVHLVFHNGFKYDSHYLIKELERQEIQEFNQLNEKRLSISDLSDFELVSTRQDKMSEDWYGVTRVKSSTSNQVTFQYSNILFDLQDSWLKCNEPLTLVGNKLLEAGYITNDYVKNKANIDFNDDKFNLDDCLYNEQINEYRRYLYNSMSENEAKYCRNDVIILAMAWKYFDKIYYGYDWKYFTFSGNVKNSYEKEAEDTYLTNFQLNKKYGKYNIKLGDYPICGYNSAEKFCRSFYYGGLNIYNDKYVGKIVECKGRGFSIDLNSSYSTVMYTRKLPTFLQSYDFNDDETKINNTDEYYKMYVISTKVFSNILDKIDSIQIRKYMIKRFIIREDGCVHISSVDIANINRFCRNKIRNFHFKHRLVWKCEFFGARNVIKNNYWIKQHSKSKLEFDCVPENFDFSTGLPPKQFNPTNIKVLSDVINTHIQAEPVVQASKVRLNGIYGIPALREFFPVFLKDKNNQMHSFPTGYQNDERNVVLSCGVTSWAMYNLLTPLTILSGEEIDNDLLYIDTDSIYFKGVNREKIIFEGEQNKKVFAFDKNNLGGWDVEHEEITFFFPCNHKKYALYDLAEAKKGKAGLTIRCAGVDKSTVKKWVNQYTNLENPVQEFVRDKFNGKATVKATRSVMTSEGTINIYSGDMEIGVGCKYSENLNPLITKFFKKYLTPEKILEIQEKQESLVLAEPDQVYQLDFEIGGSHMSLSYNEAINMLTNETENISEDDARFQASNLISKYTKAKHSIKIVQKFKSDYESIKFWFDDLSTYLKRDDLYEKIDDTTYITIDMRVLKVYKNGKIKENKLDDYGNVFIGGKRYNLFKFYIKTVFGLEVPEKTKLEDYFKSELFFKQNNISKVKQLPVLTAKLNGHKKSDYNYLKR